MQAKRILLLGDYSNCHRTLATGLRRLGCEVMVASDGTKWMQTERDIDITRRPGKIGGLFFWLKMKRLLTSKLSGFDVVAVNDPNFVKQKPCRLEGLFRTLLRRNTGVFYTAMSTDMAYLQMLEDADTPLEYSEWFVGDQPSRYHMENRIQWDEWHTAELKDYQEGFFNRIDGAVSVLYEYHAGLERYLGDERTAYGGLPIDTSLFQPVDLPDRPRKIKFFLGRDRDRKLMKGSDLLEIAARRVIERYPDKAELEIVENIPFNEFKERLRNSHVVLDQIYSYTPATTALMAMACGLNVVSGGEEDYYDFIGEKENRPIINAPVELEPLSRTLEDIVLHPELIRERGLRSREFVVKHNDCVTVAKRFLDFWEERLCYQ